MQTFKPKTNSKFSKIIISIFLSILLFASSFLITYLTLSFSKIFIKGVNKDQSLVSLDLQNSSQKEKYNILLLGYGGAGHEGGTLTDSIIVATIIPSQKKVFLTSIPRDLWVEIPIRSDITQNFKINHAYAIGLDDNLYPLKEPHYKGENGGATLAKKVVEEVVGTPIDYFVAIDFEGLKNIVDALGKVEINVPVTFDDYFYPVKGRENDTCGKSSAEIARLHALYSDTELHHQFECRYEHIHFDQGITQVDGETALKFTRSRASAEHGGDFARSERQHAVLLGIKDRLLSIYSIEKIDEIFSRFVKMVRTDLGLKIVKDLAQILGSPEDYTLKFIGLTEDNVLASTKSSDGQFILVPKEGEGVWTGVQNYIYQEVNSD